MEGYMNEYIVFMLALFGLTIVFFLFGIINFKIARKYKKQVKALKSEKPFQKDQLPQEGPAAELLQSGKRRIKSLKTLEKTIKDPGINAYSKEICIIAEQMMSFIERKPERHQGANQTVDYYLPMIRDLMYEYRELAKEPVKGENITKAMEKTRDAMQTAVEGLKQELDNLYIDKALHIEVDAEVMQAMMKKGADHANI